MSVPIKRLIPVPGRLVTVEGRFSNKKRNSKRISFTLTDQDSSIRISLPVEDVNLLPDNLKSGCLVRVYNLFSNN